MGIIQPSSWPSPSWGQFHQHFTSSLYARRSQKHKKDSQFKQLLGLLGSACVKAANKHVDEIDPRCVFLPLHCHITRAPNTNACWHILNNGSSSVCRQNPSLVDKQQSSFALFKQKHLGLGKLLEHRIKIMYCVNTYNSMHKSTFSFHLFIFRKMSKFIKYRNIQRVH